MSLGKRTVTLAGIALAWAVTSAGMTPPSRADDVAAKGAAATTASMASQITSLRQEYSEKQQDAFNAMSSATTDEERSRIYEEKAPKPQPYVRRAMEIVKQDPKAPAAFDAMVLVLRISRNGGGPPDEVVRMLSADQLDNPRLGQVFPLLVYNGSEQSQELMRTAAAKSPSREVRGLALFWLAQALKVEGEQNSSPEKLAESTTLYRRVAAEYGDVGGNSRSLGEQAKTNLFEMENLTIGKPAPEITGKDANGKEMKLSDYRGKVVVLDFWGDW